MVSQRATLVDGHGLLWLATAIKPLGIAAMGLAWAAYPHLWWRLGLGLPVFMIFPFGFGPASYIWDQYLACAANLHQSAGVTEHRFAGPQWVAPHLWDSADRPSLVCCARSGWRAVHVAVPGSFPAPAGAAAGIGLAGGHWAGFLMLFNPMTQANSYAVLAPGAGIGRLVALQPRSARCWRGAGGDGPEHGALLPEPFRPLFGNYFALAWYPAMALGFVGALVWTVFGSRLAEPVSVPATTAVAVARPGTKIKYK